MPKWLLADEGLQVGSFAFEFAVINLRAICKS
jgi:hypothetical protein